MSPSTETVQPVKCLPKLTFKKATRSAGKCDNRQMPATAVSKQAMEKKPQIKPAITFTTARMTGRESQLYIGKSEFYERLRYRKKCPGFPGRSQCVCYKAFLLYFQQVRFNSNHIIEQIIELKIGVFHSLIFNVVC